MSKEEREIKSRLLDTVPRVTVEYGPRAPDDLHYFRLEIWGGENSKMRKLAKDLTRAAMEGADV